MPKPQFISLTSLRQYPPDEMIKRSQEFYKFLKKRRTVRDFSEKELPLEVLKTAY